MIPQKMVGISTVLAHKLETWDIWADLGVKSVRAEAFWSEIEANRGEYKWDALDLLVQRAAARNIRLMVVVNYAPAWAREDMSTFVDGVYSLAHELAQRYDHVGVPVWEIFNEPNLNGYGWPFTETDATVAGQRYGQVVNAFSAGFRPFNSDAALAVGALSRHGLDIGQFLDAFIETTPSSRWDILTIHPYGLAGQQVQGASNVRQYLASKGITGKPIWMSEIGHNVDSERAAIMTAAFSEVPGLEGFFWFCEKDFKVLTYNFGSIEYWGTKKPDYSRLKTLMQAYSR